MDDGVAAGEGGPALLVEAQPVAADVAGHGRHPALDQLVEPVLAELLAEPVEGVVLQDLPADALFDARALARADQQDDLAVGDRAQEPLEQVGPEEAGGAGDEQPLAGERLTDHAEVSTTW